ncbi:alpha/beta hydrolase [Sphingomonas sp. MMSM20]|nr:alpha/beta hydrolase [Sphingomonas lycopersici]MCW6530775.1 alpha/beta hydrolase [Sphingomonas lycopersici]
MTERVSHYVRPDVAKFLEFLNSQEGPPMEELGVETARAMIAGLGQAADAPRGEIAKVEEIMIPGPGGDLKLRIYDNRPDRAAGPVMVFYHGGGWVICDLDTHDAYCAEAARQLDIPVISVDYRRAPEHVFPAAHDDAEAAARWVAGNFPCTGLVLSGDSAGGNMAIATALALREKPAATPVIAINPIYPVVTRGGDWQSFRDFAEGYLLSVDGMKWFNSLYAADPADRRAAPLDFPAEGLPPTLLITAGLDALRDQGRAYAGKLIEAGVPTIYREASGNVHGFICLAQGVPSAKADIDGGLAALKMMIAEATK